MERITTASDAELVEASRRGERAAFGALVERYQRVVCAVGYSATRDHALGEDIAQDTFVAAYQRLDQLRDTSRLREWLCAIARNLARRARRVRDREPASDDIEPVEATTPLDAATERERDTVVAAALARVPEAYREVMVLYYVEQRSAAAVASALGISTDAVHQRLSRGRQLVAGEVAELVEHTLESRRTRKNLAVLVLAALPMVTPSHANAANASEGANMWKIGIAATLVVAAVGTGYAVHHAHATAAIAKPTSNGAANPVAKALGRVRTRVASAAHSASAPPALPAVAAHYTCVDAATRLVAMAPANGSAGSPDPDAVKRMIEAMAGSDAPAILGGDGSVTTSKEAVMINLFAYVCSTEQHWSQEVIDCYATADSFWTAAMCSSLMGKPGVPPSAEAIAAVTDASCAAVGQTLGSMYLRKVTPEMLEAQGVPADVAPALIAGYEEARVDAPTDLAEICDGDGWPDELRRCIAAATSISSAEACR